MSNLWSSRKGLYAVVPLVILIAFIALSHNLATTEDGSIVMTCLQPEPSPILSYRDLLSTVYSSDMVPHSKTLGVAGKIYVIGLPGRDDRRKEMRSLQEAMGALLTF